MRMRIAQTAMAAALTVFGWTALAAEQGASERQKDLERLLADAANSFDAGKWVEARARLDKIIAEKPTNEEAWQLREMFGDRLLRQMALALVDGRDLGGGPEILLTRASEHERDRLTNPENVRLTVSRIIKNPRDRRSMHDLTLMGGYAAPELLGELRVAVEDSHRTNAALLLVNLGAQMTIPLTVALEGFNDREEWKNDETAFVPLLVDILRQILPRDPRALPALTRLAEDERRPGVVRELARRAVAEISGGILLDDPASAVERYYAAAERLHLDSPEVKRELDLLNGLFFAWDESAAGGRGGLARQFVPAFELNDLYAQDIAVTGMKLPGDGVALRFQALLARIWLDQAAEIDEYASLTGRQTTIHPDIPVHDEDVRAWRAYLESTRRKAWNVGVPGLSLALEGALLAGKAPVTLGILDALAGVARWRDITEVGRRAMLAALQSSDPRVSQRAAVALTRVGLPMDHPARQSLVAPLVEGALVKTPKVALIIANNATVREDARRNLESKGVVALVASTGQEGCRLAWQYPLKDAIFIDSEVNEFALLRQRLHSFPLVAGSELPVVIVTNNLRAATIRKQFEDDPLWRVNPVRANVDAETSGLYETLVGLNRGLDAGQRSLVVLTNDDVEARGNLAMHLRLMAERRATTLVRSELLDLLAERRQGDSPELRTLFANVFVDDELSGQNAMQTLQDLRANPLTRTTPVALLAGPENREQAEKLFEEFLKDPADARIVDYGSLKKRGGGSGDEYANDLLTAVEAMSEANPLVKLDYQKNHFRLAALACARALADYEPGCQPGLTAAQSAGLRDALRDADRSTDVRVAIADALGNWADAPSAGALAATFRNKQNSPELRLRCMVALGEADRAGREHDIKETGLSEAALPMRDAAGVALAKESAAAPERIKSLLNLWHTKPMRVIDFKPVVVGAEDDAFGEPEAAGEAKKKTDTAADDDDW